MGITSRRTNSALCVVLFWPGMPLRRIFPSTTVNFLFCSEFFFEVEFAEFLEQGSIVEHKKRSHFTQQKLIGLEHCQVISQRWTKSREESYLRLGSGRIVNTQ